MEGINLEQLREARKVREVHKNLGYKSQASIYHLVNRGYVKNFPLPPKDFRITDEILGRSTAVVKGQQKRRKTPKMIFYESLKGRTIAVEWDLMEWYGHAWFVSVTVPMSHLRVKYLGTYNRGAEFKNENTLLQAAKEMIAEYKGRKWEIKYAVYDGERAMGTSRFHLEIQNMGIQVIQLSSGRKAHRVERKIGTVKARARTIKAGLTISLPHSLVPSLIKYTEVMINADCCEANTDKQPATYVINENSPIDYNHTHKTSFLSYCLVNKETHLGTKAEDTTFHALALYPLDNPLQGWEFYRLDTKRSVTRVNFVPYNGYPEDVIQYIQQKYSSEIKEAAKIKRSETDMEPLSTLRNEEQRPLAIDRTVPLEATSNGILHENMVLAERVEVNFPIQEQENIGIIQQFLVNKEDEIVAEGMMFALQYSLKKGVKLYGQECTEATKDELIGIIKRSVFAGKLWEELSSEARRKMLRAKVMVTEKFVNGIFERLKARLVVLGNLQDKGEYMQSELSSPTPSAAVILLQAAIAAAKNRYVRTFDVGQAFLNSELQKEIHVILDKEVVDIMVTIDKVYEQFRRKDGSMIVQLMKALYGIVEAPKLWYDTLSAYLISQGFKRSELDNCYFVKDLQFGKKMDVTVHVDDGKATSDDEEPLEQLMQGLRKMFKIIKVHKGPIFDHLGMHYVYDGQGQVDITMIPFTQQLVNKFPEIGDDIAPTPHTANLFKIDKESILLSDDERERFHSAVQSCLYLSIRTRPDIACAVNHLTGRVSKGVANCNDRVKLIRVLKYLNGTLELGIRLGGNKNGEVELTSFADASYGVHPDARSQTGIFISIGRGPLIWKATKQKCVTKSSCEAEIIALSDIVSLTIWVRDLIKALGMHDDKPITIYEDNKAAINLVSDGASTSERTRHVHIRNNFISQFIESNDIRVIYCPTSKMIADIFTKPLDKAQFCFLRDYLMGYRHI